MDHVTLLELVAMFSPSEKGWGETTHSSNAPAVSLHLLRAFDNLQHRAILKSLDASTCPININRLFHSLLQNRKVTLLTPQGRATKDQKQGCPQGSCSGTALWNLVANEIHNQVWPDNAHIQAFADDFVLVIEADTNKSLVEDTQSTIAQFSS
ncbi:hypothetical protein AVEN_235190-1 [Araneus ventricosus]|uniref:Reverse transcriptase domain-containing protein n=1 Tax=Araneus ventricosus TaxID=182803 RepID=A0A4Y2LXS5_ARAVE|nr:hypothetical protein AVEN_235190-1 [Araneus ventricosus]